MRKMMLGNRRVNLTRLGVIGASAMVVSGALFATPELASAASQTSHAPTVASQSTSEPEAKGACPRKDLCFWVDVDYRGARGKVAGNNKDWRKFRQRHCRGGNWNDCASSFVNNGKTDAVVLYQDVDYRGGRLCLPRGARIADATKRHYAHSRVSLNDSVSSNKWVRHC